MDFRIIARSIFIGFSLLLAACGGEEKSKTEEQKTPETTSPVEEKKFLRGNFDADSAYQFVYKQVEFGPRVPGTATHAACADYLEATLKRFATTVIRQTGSAKAFNGKQLPIFNIVGSFNPDVKPRILLAAHWDTRPFADQDEERTDQPILGANDGASGVGVLLEIARQLAEMNTELGVDIIFFDTEDYGQPENSSYPHMPDSYCLGSQYWAKKPHVANYTARYGILLDMVGAPGAVFSQEEFSLYYAPDVVRYVWNTAGKLGFGSYFQYSKWGPITDDHYYVNTIRQVPMIDIIHNDRATRSGFGAYWHTHDDNLDAIDKATLNAVGQTVMATILNF